MRHARRTGRRAQSTLEYILILAVIVAAIILAANGPIKNAVRRNLNESSNLISSATNKLSKGLSLNTGP